MVAFLLLAIISSSAFLMIIVTGGVWLSRIGELEGDNGPMTTFTLVIEILAVAGGPLPSSLPFLHLIPPSPTGVCFILTSAFICHRFAHKVMKYQIVGRITQPVSDPFVVHSRGEREGE